MIGKTTFLFGIACFLGAKPVKLPGSNSHGNVNSFNFIFFCSIRWAILSAKGSHRKKTPAIGPCSMAMLVDTGVYTPED